MAFENHNFIIYSGTVDFDFVFKGHYFQIHI